MKISFHQIIPYRLQSRHVSA